MIRVIKRKRKRNPTLRKEVLRQVAELLAKTLYYNRAEYFYLAQELAARNSTSCEQCMSGNIETDCDWTICFPEMYDICENCDMEMINCECNVKDLAEDLAEDLGIEKRWLEVFIYSFQLKNNALDLRMDGRDLSNLDLSGINLSRGSLEKVNLTNSDLSNSNLSSLGLGGSNLSGVDLSESNLKNVALYKVNLSRADLSKSDLYRSTLSDSNLSNTDLSGTNLSETWLRNTNFTNAKITKSTNFTNAHDIDKAINLRIPNPKGSIMLKKKKTTAKKVAKKTTASRKRNPADHVIDRKIAHTEDELDWAIDSGDRAAARFLERRLEALEFARGVYAAEDSKVRNPRKKITKRKSTTCKKCKCKNCKCR